MSSFQLPCPYEGMTREQLVERCSALVGACMEWELIAANMGVAPGALDQLTPASRAKVEAIMRAYSD